MATDFKFSGFSTPNFTPIPDQFFDQLLAKLGGAELKVVLYVMRRTFGFKKGTDRISKSQLENGINAENTPRKKAGAEPWRVQGIVR